VVAGGGTYADDVLRKEGPEVRRDRLEMR